MIMAHTQVLNEEKQALDAYIKLTRAADTVNVAINTHLRDHKLTTSQFGVLEALYHLGALQTGELGEKILKSSGNMTVVIDNLEKRGLVNRLPRDDDRRCIEIHLTEMGRSLVRRILPAHVEGVVKTFAVLSEEEQRQIAALCRKLGLQRDG